MPHALIHLALIASLLAALPAGADEDADAYIVTGIDVSDSVTGAERRDEIAALAEAIRSPGFVAAVRRGPSGRVVIAVFLWHHLRLEVLPWTVVGSPAEAAAAARLLEAGVAMNLGSAPGSGARYIGRLTDLSGALEHAGGLLAEAGAPAGRSVVNILGNGADNYGEPPAAARARLLAAGATVNGVVFGDEPGVADYYRAEVVGGAGAFVMRASQPATLAETMQRKLLRDLVATR